MIKSTHKREEENGVWQVKWLSFCLLVGKAQHHPTVLLLSSSQERRPQRTRAKTE